MSDHRQPAEWAEHASLYVGWPGDAEEWGGELAGARGEIADLVLALSDPDEDTGACDIVDLVAAPGEPAAAAWGEFAEEIAAGRVRIVELPIGDVWLRDTGPIFTKGADGEAAASFAFNGWGGKYVMGEDAKIASLIAASLGVPERRFAQLVAEGGAIEVDGEGTAILTRQCFLNDNRNPGADEADIEAVMREALGIERVLWLDEGLMGDHTDGHTDNIARFLAPGLIVIQHPYGDDDPNRDVYAAIKAALLGAVDAAGRTVDLLEIPSPGRVELGGEVAAASHMNFIIGNGGVFVPHYVEAGGAEEAAESAFDLLMDAAPRDGGAMLPSHEILTGGGSFHCITQQRPR